MDSQPGIVASNRDMFSQQHLQYHTLATCLLALATSFPKAPLQLDCALKIAEVHLGQFVPGVAQVAYHHMYKICTRWSEILLIWSKTICEIMQIQFPDWYVYTGTR